tara:strand:+ start:12172 stop:13257 length:1086 start_codon:yes stop_codon:yes gene_type:complete
MYENKFQQRAIDLAKECIGKVSPRPAVGAVIVLNNKIIGEGKTNISPGSHAEIEAIKNTKGNLNGAILYCTLEPHNFKSKDIPCTEQIIKSGISEVSCPTIDLNPKVNGQGFNDLKKAGLKIVRNWDDCKIKQCDELYEAYNFKIVNNKPFISVKLAMTLDGKIATKTNESKWITNEESRDRVHEIRGFSDAIITGINSVIHDNPKLNSRINKSYIGNPKYRVILDNYGKLDENFQIYSNQKLGKVIWFTMINVSRKNLPNHITQIKSIEKIKIHDVIKELNKLGCNSILVESGGTLVGSFFDKKIVDKVYAFIAPTIFGGKDAPSAVEGEGIIRIKDRINLTITSIEDINEDILIIGRTK